MKFTIRRDWLENGTLLWRSSRPKTERKRQSVTVEWLMDGMVAFCVSRPTLTGIMHDGIEEDAAWSRRIDGQQLCCHQLRMISTLSRRHVSLFVAIVAAADCGSVGAAARQMIARRPTIESMAKRDCHALKMQACGYLISSRDSWLEAAMEHDIAFVSGQKPETMIVKGRNDWPTMAGCRKLTSAVITHFTRMFVE